MSPEEHRAAAIAEVASGSKYQTLTYCPAHDDQNNPNLVVRRGDEPQSVHVYCNSSAGCKTEDICRELEAEEIVYSWATKAAKDPNTFVRLPVVPAKAGLPDAAQVKACKHVYRYKDLRGELVAVVLRFERLGQDGELKKSVIPYFWGHLEGGGRPQWKAGWRPDAQGDKRRPLYNQEQLRTRPLAKVMFHEGEKAVEAAHDILQDLQHPWHLWYRQFVHVSTMGGAKAVYEADLSAVRGKEVWISRDNDKAGLDYAADLIARLGTVASGLYVSRPELFKQLPDKWDIADGVRGIRWQDFERAFRFVSPPYRVTQEVGPRGGITNHFHMRPQFAAKMVYLKNRDTIVERRLSTPDAELSSKQMQANHAQPGFPGKNSFNEVANSLHCLRAFDYGVSPAKAFGELFDKNGVPLVNIYKQPPFEASEQPEEFFKPFRQYLSHLVPDERERQILFNWFCMVVGNRTDDRGFLWSPLLISTKQGVGKSTLFLLIEGLLHPDASTEIKAHEVTDKWTDWARGKRFIYIEEASEGGQQAFLLGNKLKTHITQPRIPISEKNKNNTVADNHAFWGFSSNHKSGIYIETADRRYFVPTVTETVPDDKLFLDLWSWFYKLGGREALLGLAERRAAEMLDLLGTDEGAEQDIIRVAPYSNLREEIKGRMQDEFDDLMEDALSDVNDEFLFDQADLVKWVRQKRKEEHLQFKGNPLMRVLDWLSASGYSNLHKDHAKGRFAVDVKVDGETKTVSFKLWGKMDQSKFEELSGTDVASRVIRLTTDAHARIGGKVWKPGEPLSLQGGREK